MFELLACESPGIPEIQQVEMFTKWRPLLPPYARDLTCPRPLNAVMQRIKDKRNKKGRKKEEEKGIGKQQKLNLYGR